MAVTDELTDVDLQVIDGRLVGTLRWNGVVYGMNSTLSYRRPTAADTLHSSNLTQQAALRRLLQMQADRTPEDERSTASGYIISTHILRRLLDASEPLAPTTVWGELIVLLHLAYPSESKEAFASFIAHEANFASSWTDIGHILLTA